MHQSSYDRCSDFVGKYLMSRSTLHIADIGSIDISGTYRHLFMRNGWHYTGFDLSSGPNVDVVLKDPEDWALDAQHLASYDVVVSGQVLEHVRRPWLWIHQITALVRDTGLVWLCAPNTDDYHAYPIDCWRVWPDGMRALLEDGRLEVLDCLCLGIDTVGIGRKIGALQ